MSSTTVDYYCRWYCFSVYCCSVRSWPARLSLHSHSHICHPNRESPDRVSQQQRHTKYALTIASRVAFELRSRTVPLLALAGCPASQQAPAVMASEQHRQTGGLPRCKLFTWLDSLFGGWPTIFFAFFIFFFRFSRSMVIMSSICGRPSALRPTGSRACQRP